MATRSTIAIQNADGTVTGIYCHWDGYLSHNGNLLYQFYRDEATVRALIGLGHISSLGREIGERHPFETYNLSEEEKDPRWEGWTTAYGRDRGEQQDAETFRNWYTMLNEQGQEYNYLFVPGKGWQVQCYGGTYDLNADLLNEDAAA
jgi:hypothetical protein